MNIMQSSIYALGIGFCLFSLLLLRHDRADTPVRFFKLFIVIQTLRFGFEWLMIHPSVPLTMLWLFLVMSLSLLIAPLAWAFARDISTSGFHLNRQQLMPHLCVIAFGIVLLVPLFSTLFADSTINGLRWPGAPEYAMVHVTMLLMAGVFLVQSTYYVYGCTRLFNQRVEQNKGLFTEVADQGSNTLRILIVAVIANSVVSLLRVLYCWVFDEMPVVNTFLALLQIVCVAYLACAVMHQTFGKRERLNQERHALFGQVAKRVKYQHSGLGNERRSDILSALNSLLNEEKIHRVCDINLSKVCSELGASAQDVSQVINQSSYGNFYQMIHQHRIADAQALLKTDSETSILEIAYEVGYRSKSTFNSAFKRLSNCSPSEYRARVSNKAKVTHLPA